MPPPKPNLVLRKKLEKMAIALVKLLGCEPRDAWLLMWANCKHDAADHEIKRYYEDTFTTKGRF